MKNRQMLFLALACAFLSVQVASAAPRDVMLAYEPGATGPTLDLMTGGTDGCNLRFTLPSLQVEDVDAGGQTWQALTIEHGSLAGDPGAPGLPVFTRFIAVPPGHTASLRAVVNRRQTMDVLPLMPVQRDDGEDFVLDRAAYAAAATDPEPVVLGAPVIMHGVQLVPITIQPVSYDPSRQQVDIATEIALECTFTPSGASDDEFFVATSFDAMLDDIAVNWDSVRAEALIGPGTYVMITPNMADVTAAIQPLVEWRKRQGYNVIVATTAQAGTTNAQIKTYLQNLYATVTPRLEHICLVGDASGTVALPTWNENLSSYHGEGDHYYTTIGGSDNIADCHLGRLSVRNVTELTTVINKILGYERTPPLTGDPEWFHRAALTGDRSSSGISTIYCQQWLRAQLEDLGYTDIDTIYSSPFASRMLAAGNLGGTVFAYRGYLGVSGFNTGYIDQLANGAELSFAVIPTCGSGSFASSTHAYSEAFLRNANGGAVGSIGTATSGTHTRFNNCYFSGVWEGALNTGGRTLGAAHTFGKFELHRNFGMAEVNNVEIWSVWNNLMGDPATAMWQNLPTTLTVDYPATLPMGATTVPVTVTVGGQPVVGATVAAVKGAEIRAVGLTDASGRILLALPASYTAGSMFLTVTGSDLLPFLGAITLGSVDAYASVTGFQVDGDGVVNAGETFSLGLSLTNLGSQVAGAVAVTLTSEDPGVSVLQDGVDFGDIPAGSTVTRGSFMVQTDPHLANGSVVNLRVSAASGGDVWDSRLQLPIVAAAPIALASSWSAGGGRANPGETGTFTINIRNDGALALTGTTVRIASRSRYVMLTGPAVVDGGPLPIGGTTSVAYQLQIAPDAFGGQLAPLALEVTTAQGSIHDLTTFLSIGTASADSPSGPDAYGYLAFDNLDDSPLAPTYSWVEIDPNYGGQGTDVGLSDFAYEQDDTRAVALPFTFRYYGRDFTSIAICSNGFAAMGTTTLNPFHNLYLPSANSPNAMLAVFWDDLIQSGTNRVYRWHDAANGRFVIQWSRMRNYDNGTQNCELILLDPTRYPTATGDGIILMQYAAVANNDSDRAYCTTGIQNLDGTGGLTYTYYNRYAGNARTLAAGRAIAFVPVAAAGANDMSLDPAAISAEIASGESTTQPLTISATGPAGSLLYYTVTPDPSTPWLTVDAGSGVVPSGDSEILAVTLDADGLVDGIYTSALTIHTTGSAPVTVPVTLHVGLLTAVDTGVPQVLTLAPAHPNPFNPRTVLSFALPTAGRVQLSIHDLAGRRLAVLVDEVRSAGPHQVAWDGTDATGRRLASGTYVARIVAGGDVQAQKLQLVK